VGGVDIRARAADESEPSRALPPTSMFDAAEDELVEPVDTLGRGRLFRCFAMYSADSLGSRVVVVEIKVGRDARMRRAD
jgi:hypothetical protein